MSQAFDDDFDLDMEVGGPLVYVFDPGDGRTADTLARIGIEVRPASTGSEVMAAAQNGELAGVIIAPFADEELRELFMVAFRGNFPEIAVVYVHEQAQDPQVQEDSRNEGATLVLPWPLPQNIEAQLSGVFGELASADPGSGSAERQVLVRKLGAIDPPRDTLDLIPKKELVRAAEEATSLRSELTLVRERSELLQRRIERLNQDLASVTHQRDNLERKLKSDGDFPRPATKTVEMTPEIEKRLAVLQKVGANAENFVWGVEQTIQYLEELQFEAGDRRAPSLESHIKILRLTRKLLTQLQKYSKGI